eukprot:360056-Chlamydomonas_euryale.AAC.3
MRWMRKKGLLACMRLQACAAAPPPLRYAISLSSPHLPDPFLHTHRSTSIAAAARAGTLPPTQGRWQRGGGAGERRFERDRVRWVGVRRPLLYHVSAGMTISVRHGCG